MYDKNLQVRLKISSLIGIDPTEMHAHVLQKTCAGQFIITVLVITKNATTKLITYSSKDEKKCTKATCKNTDEAHKCNKSKFKGLHTVLCNVYKAQRSIN